MESKPGRLISNTEKVDQIRRCICPKCHLTRRSNRDTFLTPSGVIDPFHLSDRDIFNMSCNIYNCYTCMPGPITDPLDVNTILLHEGVPDNEPFISDNQIQNLDLEQIQMEERDDVVLSFEINKLLELEGEYPYKKGQRDEVIFIYKLSFKYDPLVLNCFHVEVQVLTNELDKENFEILDRNDTKHYHLRSIGSDVRAAILSDNIVSEVPKP